VALIEKKLEKAEQAFRLYGNWILEEKEISSLLKEHRKAIENTWRIMKELNIPEACSRCAEKDPGGCCFEGVETWYTPVQLLINMLMGVNIPMSSMFDGICAFAGEKGCLLLSRNAFCINFLCDKIKKHRSREDIDILNSSAGKEIDCGIRLENAITKWLLENKVQLYYQE
jgi:hypothetical protein